MVTVERVCTNQQKREFLEFPLRLYENNPNFVPPLFGDERKIFDEDYAYYETSEAVYFNAYRDGQIVGRISGILQQASNELRNENLSTEGVSHSFKSPSASKNHNSGNHSLEALGKRSHSILEGDNSSDEKVND
mgnify:CR=1 FL=1